MRAYFKTHQLMHYSTYKSCCSMAQPPGYAPDNCRMSTIFRCHLHVQPMPIGCFVNWGYGGHRHATIWLNWTDWVNYFVVAEWIKAWSRLAGQARGSEAREITVPGISGVSGSVIFGPASSFCPARRFFLFRAWRLAWRRRPAPWPPPPSA